MSFDLITAFGVLPFSHNVVTKYDTTIGWIFKMANVSMVNSGVLVHHFGYPQTYGCFGPKKNN